MTDEQINLAITEATNADPHWKCAKDYCSDLNAMAEAEKVLCEQKADLYFFVLHDVAGNLMYHRATARQRAEAFLRTLGKWEEVQR